MVQEITKYKNVLDNVHEKLKKSDYKISFIVKQVGIPTSTFYTKLKNKSFSVDEMLVIAKYI